MKVTAHIFALTIIAQLASCGKGNQEKTDASNQSDTTKTFVYQKEEERLAKRKMVEEQEKIDSLNDQRILREAIEFAEKHKAQDKFEKSYVSTMPDSSHQVDVDINCGFHFSTDIPHLVVKRTTPNAVYIDIFSKANKQFQQVLSHQQWNLEFTGDSIGDINGDGLKDFVVNWYGTNGCCLKTFSDVYLQRADKKTFSNSFNFINPTFSPKEQVIRGVCYGHPGETEMYKYKWNDEMVDTVEYIYFEKNAKGKKTGKLIISNHRQVRDNHKVLKRLSYVPPEYQTIKGYDWFADNLNETGNR